jgi:hypothetical protein
MEEARGKMQGADGESQGTKSSDSQPQKKMAIEVVSKETGEKKAINGFDTRQGDHDGHDARGRKTDRNRRRDGPDDGLLAAPPIAAMKEAQEFDRRYMEKLSGLDAAAMAQQMTAALAMFPGLGEALSARACRRREARWHGDDDDDDRRRGEEP